jgi:sulfur carrier protein ThiS
MRVKLELYASLMKHLPPEAERHRVSAEVPAGTTAVQLLDRYRVPLKQAHLVLRNGVYLDRAQREQIALEDGDVIAVWPPVAGG